MKNGERTSSTDNGTLIIRSDEMEGSVEMDRIISGLEDAFRGYHEGEAWMPPKSYLEVPQYDGDFRSMPAFVNDSAGVKWVNVHPNNPERYKLPTVMGLVILSDPRSGYPVALMDGTVLTRYRTGAVAGLATRYLAPDGASSLGLLGAGEQAHTQLWAIQCVSPIETVVVYDIDDQSVNEFIQSQSRESLTIEPGTPEEVASCDIVSTTTPSEEPILEYEWFSERTHVNAMGADAEGKQELSTESVSAAELVIDDWEQCSHSGEINRAVSAGALDRGDIAAELSEIVAKAELIDRNQFTVFDSTGLAIQDIACAGIFHRAALDADAGMPVKIVGD